MISTRRILAGALAAAAVTLAVSTPALADPWKHRWGPPWRHHHGYYYDRGPDVVVVRPRPRVYYEPAPVYVERPPVYYERPAPVYVAPPPPVYVAPAPGISVNIPLRFD
ncbi:hypothetical protein [Inquilinus sp. Marseille-Q2685]|uniref:hypothetical protein n=1 Tax=Inquilinus sp. Marseille-Q2685 TaxID=2866581 RepID=UPI001CE4791D|nr:hypothetical protein [Inquilinus sp. Marseille-Q2685]